MDKYKKSTLEIIAAVSIVSVVYVVLAISGLFSFSGSFIAIWVAVTVPAITRRQRLRREREQLNRA